METSTDSEGAVDLGGHAIYLTQESSRHPYETEPIRNKRVRIGKSNYRVIEKLSSRDESGWDVDWGSII